MHVNGLEYLAQSYKTYSRAVWLWTIPSKSNDVDPNKQKKKEHTSRGHYSVYSSKTGDYHLTPHRHFGPKFQQKHHIQSQ